VASTSARPAGLQARPAPIAAIGFRNNAADPDAVELVAAWEAVEERPADAGPAPEPDAPPAGPVAVVNSKRIQLDYEVKDADPAGVSAVEVWYTHGRRGWQKYAATERTRPPFVVEVEEEGLYGFTLVASNEAGAGRPPRDGEPAQLYVVVDQTKPNVAPPGVQPDGGPASGQLTITWKASDRNPDPHGTALLWAKDAGGPWLPIVSGLEASGRYAWQAPADLPTRFWVRAEVTDRAGNVATADTPEPVVLDRSRPAASVRAAEPAAAAAAAPARRTGAGLKLADE
jgi:hypothetical protein